MKNRRKKLFLERSYGFNKELNKSKQAIQNTTIVKVSRRRTNTKLPKVQSSVCLCAFAVTHNILTVTHNLIT